MLKKIAAGVVTVLLSLGAVVFLAGPASAHHNTIWPEVTCAVDGTYNISWSVENSETNKTEVITESNLPAIVPVGTSFGFHEKKYFPQNVSTPQTITMTLTGFWDGNTSTTADDVYNTTSYTLTPDRFPTGCLTVTPNVTQNPSVCNGPNSYTDPSYTITKVTGVKYTVDGQPKGPGTYPATNGSTVHIEASVTDSSYKINGTSVWDFTFAAPARTCTVEVEPVTPEVKQQVCTGPGTHSAAQYIIPSKTGVLYSVKIDGTETDVAAGTYNVPAGVGSIQIIARGDTDNFYTLKGGTQIYDFTFDLSNQCLVDLKPKTPEVSDGQCDVVNHPGVVPPQTYALTGVEGVVYRVSTDGGTSFTDVVVANGSTQTFPATPGTNLVIRAVTADAAKWTVTFTEYTHLYGNPGDCKLEVTPIAPDAVGEFCDETDLSNPFLVPGTITLTAVPGVDYFIDGVPAATGAPITVSNGTHSVTTSFDASKYKLAPGAVGSFTVTINAGECLPTEPLVTPIVTSTQLGCFTHGSYTLGNDLDDDAAIIWTVDGSQVAPDTYTVTGARTVTISAAPNAPVYGFQEGVQTSWTFTFTKPSVCDLETLALTGQSPTGLLLAADMLVVAGLVMFAMRAVRRARPIRP